MVGPGNGRRRRCSRVGVAALAEPSKPVGLCAEVVLPFDQSEGLAAPCDLLAELLVRREVHEPWATPQFPIQSRRRPLDDLEHRIGLAEAWRRPDEQGFGGAGGANYPILGALLELGTRSLNLQLVSLPGLVEVVGVRAASWIRLWGRATWRQPSQSTIARRQNSGAPSHSSSRGGSSPVRLHRSRGRGRDGSRLEDPDDP